jgi:hypothetical protein
MKRQTAIILLAIFALLVALAVSADKIQRDSPLRAAFGDSRYDACGLGKLSAEEQQELIGLMATAPRYSYLEESAIRFLEQEGWDRIELFGYQNMSPAGQSFPKKYLITFRKSEIKILEPSLLADTLSPGQYWVKVSGSTWSILSPSGKKIDFWARDWK